MGASQRQAHDVGDVKRVRGTYFRSDDQLATVTFAARQPVRLPARGPCCTVLWWLMAERVWPPVWADMSKPASVLHPHDGLVRGQRGAVPAWLLAGRAEPRDGEAGAGERPTGAASDLLRCRPPGLPQPEGAVRPGLAAARCGRTFPRRSRRTSRSAPSPPTGPTTPASAMPPHAAMAEHGATALIPVRRTGHPGSEACAAARARSATLSEAPLRPGLSRRRLTDTHAQSRVKARTRGLKASGRAHRLPRPRPPSRQDPHPHRPHDKLLRPRHGQDHARRLNPTGKLRPSPTGAG
jgi:hypothetical protein